MNFYQGEFEIARKFTRRGVTENLAGHPEEVMVKSFCCTIK